MCCWTNKIRVIEFVVFCANFAIKIVDLLGEITLKKLLKRLAQLINYKILPFMGQAKLKNVSMLFILIKNILHATVSSNWFDGAFINYVSSVLHIPAYPMNLMLTWNLFQLNCCWSVAIWFVMTSPTNVPLYDLTAVTRRNPSKAKSFKFQNRSLLKFNFPWKKKKKRQKSSWELEFNSFSSVAFWRAERRKKKVLRRI